MTAEEIKALIGQGMPEAQVQVRDSTGGGDHFEALVISPAFRGKTLLERHQLVYGTLGDAMRSRIHALALKTQTPEEAGR